MFAIEYLVYLIKHMRRELNCYISYFKFTYSLEYQGHTKRLLSPRLKF
jgi:hypothetical protein